MRARLLKPGFFEDPKLCQLPYGARLLFAGLWCLADRDGKVLDLPRRISAIIFPHERAGIERKVAQWLKLLESEWIVRYDADGKKCLKIKNFAKHQRCHPDEKRSELPDEPNTNPIRIQYESHENPIRIQYESTSEAKAEAITKAKAEAERRRRRPAAASGAFDASECVSRMISLHPRQDRAGNPVTVGRALAQVLDGAPDPEATLRVIESNHAAWCQSDEWTREDGRYCPSLVRWMRDGRCYDTPPAPRSDYSEYRQI